MIRKGGGPTVEERGDPLWVEVANDQRVDIEMVGREMVVGPHFPKTSEMAVYLASRSKFARKRFRQQQGRCILCDLPLTASTMSIEHVWPRSKGGTDSWRNKAWAHVRCNQIKSGDEPTDAILNRFMRVRGDWQPRLAYDGKRKRKKKLQSNQSGTETLHQSKSTDRASD
jgi:hypothetical protein